MAAGQAPLGSERGIPRAAWPRIWKPGESWAIEESTTIRSGGLGCSRGSKATIE
jgi:hypothetical protein